MSGRNAMRASAITTRRRIRVVRERGSRGSRPGLSLLETTIAIGVIVTGLFAAFTLVVANRRTSDDAALRFGAVAAAREGVEVVRLIRDSNWLSEQARAWDAGIAGSSGGYTGIARFNPSDALWQIEFGVAGFTDARTRIVRLESVGGSLFWTQGLTADAAGDATPYRRLIDAFPICSDGSVVESGAPCDAASNPMVGIAVRSRVLWTSSGRSHTVTAEERLYNWR